jgi:hypothetical protein
LQALEAIRKAGIYQGELSLAASLGEGLMRVARGDWHGGLEALQRSEGSRLPLAARLGAARAAAMGAWLSAVDPAVADTILRRVRELARNDSSAENRVEFLWMDGVIGTAAGDEARVRNAMAQLRRETIEVASTATRSLAGLWLERSDPEAAADSLRALTDLVMRDGDSFLSIEALDRLVVARALRQRGRAADAERYLMWIDAGVNTPRNGGARISMVPLVAYERGVALDEAGHPEAAAYQLRRVLEMLDMPPEAHRPIVEDARRRLQRIERGDSPPLPKTVK